MEYKSGHSVDDKSYMPEDDDMESSDSDFSYAWEDNMSAKTVVVWTFVTDSFSDHRETSLKEYNKEFYIHPALVLSDAKSTVDYFEICEKFLRHLCLH